MLFTITCTGRNTTGLGYLLYKNPVRPQMFELNHGKALCLVVLHEHGDIEGVRHRHDRAGGRLPGQGAGGLWTYPHAGSGAGQPHGLHRHRLLARLQTALGASGFWADFETDWVCIDAELMPW